MKAKKVEEPKDSHIYLKDDNYIAEIKYDGQRRFLQFKNGVVKLFNKQMVERKCPQEIIDEVLLKFGNEKTGIFSEFILDGELVYIDKANNTQHRTQAQNTNAELSYMVFDIVSLGNENLTNKTNEFVWTWEKRRVELESVCNFANWIPEADNVIQIVYFVSSTEYKQKLLDFTRDNSLEGIVLKNKYSTYDSNTKRDMVKIKFSETDDYIVIGYTEASEKSINTKGEEIDNKRYPYFKALVLAQYDKNNILTSRAQVGGGFKDCDLLEITQMLKKDKCIVLKDKDDRTDMHNLNDKDYNQKYGNIKWLPKEDWFVIEIKMMNKTEYSNPFQPGFLTLRSDKLVEDCKEE